MTQRVVSPKINYLSTVENYCIFKVVLMFSSGMSNFEKKRNRKFQLKVLKQNNKMYKVQQTRSIIIRVQTGN